MNGDQSSVITQLIRCFAMLLNEFVRVTAPSVRRQMI
jgi:hypothetical protein